MDESWNDRFFGRDWEIGEVLGLLRHAPVVSIVADSGAGKSSLAMAGVGAAWRGGAFAERRDTETFWNVITIRPRDNPMESFARDLTAAAQAMNLPLDTQGTLRSQLATSPSEALYALECGLPAGKVRSLLILDQAEELVTATRDPKARAAFGAFLAEMVRLGGGDARLCLLLTVRADYANLVSGVPGIGRHLREEGAVFRLGLPSGDDIAETVDGPLRMAGYADEDEIEALAGRLRTDLSDRSGDLALAQMALSLVWRDRAKHGDSLTAAYNAIGRVFGALGQEAERVTDSVLSHGERDLVLPLFVRLLRLGDNAGATRRIAPLEEFTKPQRDLIDRLAGEHCGRLLQTTETTVEIAHESLLTQWPELHQYVLDREPAIRSLGRLMAASDRWIASGRRRGFLAKQVDLDEFTPVQTSTPTWLSAQENTYLRRSRRALTLARAALAAVFLLIMGLAGTSYYLFDAGQKAEARATDLTEVARELREGAQTAQNAADAAEGRATELERQANASRQLAEAAELRAGEERSAAEAARQRAQEEAERAEVEREAADAARQQASAEAKRAEAERRAAEAAQRTAMAVLARTRAAEDPHSAIKLVLSAWPQDAQPSAALSQNALNALSTALDQTKPHSVFEGHGGEVQRVAFSPDGRRIVSGSDDGTLRLWEAERPTEVVVLRGHEGTVESVAFSPDGLRIVSGGVDRTVRLWEAASGAEVGLFRGHRQGVWSVASSPGGRRIVSGSYDGTLRLWEAERPTEVVVLRGHEGTVESVAFSPDGRRIVSGGRDGTLRLRNSILLEGNILQLACQFLPLIDGQRDLDTADIAAEIGLPDPAPLTPCEDYDPPLRPLGG